MEPGKWIRRERRKKGWTQAELGSRLDPPVAHQQIQKWENSSNLELRTLRRIHNALPIPEVGLLIGIDNPTGEVEIAPGVPISADLARDLAEIASTEDGRGVLTELFRLYAEGPEVLAQAHRILTALTPHGSNSNSR
ncbi:TPA: hypothetical protein DCE37_04615 [Candidatus Latescibacteria bacterium]|nr:hypothetical protein [Candidatus Latescibacterota bacterium]|tara:strand:+ start:147 stop:557 length:411 start_codon:yes stop_codon:yes gene_type:complete